MADKKQIKPEIDALVTFLKETQDGKYCEVKPHESLRVNIVSVDTEDELYYYSISNWYGINFIIYSIEGSFL